MFEAESVAVFADAFAFSVAHVSADDCHDAHLGACEVALGGYVVNPAEFVGVFGRDGEGEFGLGVVDSDGAGGDGVVFLYCFGESKAEGAVVELLRDQFGLVGRVWRRGDVGEGAEAVADGFDAFILAFDLRE